MTDTQTSNLIREVLSSGTATTSASALAREVLLSQVTQTWASVIAREVLASGGIVTARQYAVVVGVA